MDLHTLLGTHKYAATVDMRGKTNALLGDLAQLCKRENLKSAAIGEHGALPIHKLADTAHIADQCISRTKMEMIGVGKLDLAIQLTQFHGIYAALDRGTGANVHENRRLDIAVNRVKHASARTAVGGK